MSSDPPLTSAGLSLARQVSMEVKLSAVRQAHDRGQSLTAWVGGVGRTRHRRHMSRASRRD